MIDMIGKDKGVFIFRCVGWWFSVLLTLSCGNKGIDDNKATRGEEFESSVDVHFDEAMTPKIMLLNKSIQSKHIIQLIYTGAKDAESGPRVAEIILDVSENMTLVSSEPGDAVKDAGKELIVQELPDNHQIRLVIVAMDNVNELDSGLLATLTVKKKDNEPSTVRILTESPIFAPEAANEGLLVSDPITF